MSFIPGRRGAATLLGSALSLLATAAVAHPYLYGPAVESGQHFRGELRLTHDCGDQPTVEVVLRLPAQSTMIEGTEVKGWPAKVDAAKGEITWRGEPISGKVSLPFGFHVPQRPSGEALYFPVIQRCRGGETYRWVETPAAGQDHDSLAFPAAVAIVGQPLALPEGEQAEGDENPHAGHHAHHHGGHDAGAPGTGHNEPSQH